MEGLLKIEKDNQLNFNNLTESSIPNKIGKFYESKDLPNKIIRVENSADLLGNHDNKMGLPELVETVKGLYKELDKKYGIIAPAQFFIEKNNKGEDVACSVVDKIKGEHFEKFGNHEDLSHKVEKLYASIANYFFDKYKEGGLYIWDINGESQYIYGKKEGDKENNIYLIDTDIWLSKSREDMSMSFYWLARHMSGLENHFGIQFKEARNLINKFVNEFVSEEVSGNKNIDEIKKILNNEKSDYNPESAIPRFE